MNVKVGVFVSLIDDCFVPVFSSVEDNDYVYINTEFRRAVYDVLKDFVCKKINYVQV